ncbi:hypothetical protein ParaKuw1_00039 [Paracoccus phage ParKuw1]|uniref:Uncharacterized protein n=1 Tax=Paracoccus phage ParKuw1 TaxID=3032415 RepID=A0AAF0JI71_9CAUD|nr:hypothetical protein ParaKuw1_00039 [Paracoccus phage ParKuw1]
MAEEQEMTVEHCEAMADYYQKQIDTTLARYGSGVRPSWVSADIGIDQMHRDHYRNLAKRLRQE